MKPLTQSFLPPGTRIIAPFDLVLGVVAERYHVTSEQMVSRARPMHIAWPRQICMWLMRQNFEYGLCAIGGFFARDHSTVCTACASVKSRMEAYPEVAAVIQAMDAEIKAALKGQSV